MRHLPGVVARALEVTLFVLLWCPALQASAGEAADTGTNDAAGAARALEQASAALAARPQQAAEARRALGRACAPGSQPRAAAEAYFRLGVLDESELKFPLALKDYGQAATEAPNTVWARNARKRISWLREHAEGDFVPLTRFEAARRDSASSDGAPELETLARDADAFPEGRTRSEARMLVAQTWLRSPQRSGDAADELQKILTDTSAEPRTKVFAERDLVGFWLARGALDQAAEVLRAYPLDPQLVAKVQGLSRARRLRRAAVVISALLGVVVASLVARRGRRERRGRSAIPHVG